MCFYRFHFFFFVVFFCFCFDEVSNFCNRILTNQKRELVVSNCQLNCLWRQLFQSLCSRKVVETINIFSLVNIKLSFPRFYTFIYDTFISLNKTFCLIIILSFEWKKFLNEVFPCAAAVEKNWQILYGLQFFPLLFLFAMHLCHHGLNVTRLFNKQRFVSTQPQCCLTFPWIKLQMLLRCYLIHVTIIILRHLYLVYSSPCLGLGLFNSYLFNWVLLSCDVRVSEWNYTL